MSVSRSSLVFSAGTFLSRITGLIRDRVMFSVFGANTALDAFIIAMRIPNLMREMLAEGTLGSSFTKVYTELGVKDPKRAKQLLVDSLWILTLFSIVISVIGVVAAPWIVEAMTYMAKDQGPELKTIATGLSRLVIPIIGFMVMGAVCMGALHKKGRFFLTAVAPIIYNIGYIVGSLLFAGWILNWNPPFVTEWFGDAGLTGLAIGVLIGAAGQMAIQMWGLWKPALDGQFPKPRLVISDDFKKVMVLMFPMVIAAAAPLINQLVITNYSTVLEPGTVTRLLAAFRILHLPVALFAVALGVAVLPALTRSVTKAGGVVDEEASGHLQNALEFVLWLMTPCLLVYFFCSKELIQCFFQSGKFGEADVAASALALSAYSFALIAYGMNKVLTAFYFAVDRTTWPMRVGFFSIASNFVLLHFMVEFGIMGMAAAFSVSVTLNSMILIYGVRHSKVAFNAKKLLRSIGWIGASTVIVILLLVIGNIFTEGLDLSHWPIFFSSLTMLTLKGLVVLVVFVTTGSIFLQTTPRGLLTKLKHR